MIEILTALLCGAIAAVGTLLAFMLSLSLGFIEGKLERKMVLFISAAFVSAAAVSLLNSITIAEQAVNLVLIVFMTLFAYIDLVRHIVPNKLIISMLICYLTLWGIVTIFDVASGFEMIFRAIAGSLFAGLTFLLCYIVSHRQLGGGDVKLSFVMGLYLTGSRIIGTLVYGMLLCLAFSLIQLARKKITMKDGVPLVPFLWIGTLFTLIIAG